MIAQPPTPVKQTERFLSLDVFRGIVMVFLMTEATLELPRLASYYPNSSFWRFIAYQTSHELWIGCRAWDLIQPSFMFIVGMAVPFSIAARLSRGATGSDLWKHTWRRAIILILLGILLRSMGRAQTYFTFEDVITQVGLGYPILVWLGFRPVRTQWLAFALILIGYWALFAFSPVSHPELMQEYNRADNQPYQPLTGFFAHWNIHTNPANTFDQWFLNLFPREKPFVVNRGGYVTLSFIPSLGTMLLGLLAGQRLRRTESVRANVRTLVIWGLVGVALAVALQVAGVCPIVKRIWTPTWVLFSGGLVLLMLAGCVWAVELGQWRRGTFWFVVVGANSMAAYLLHWTIHNWLVDNVRTNTSLFIGGLSAGVQHLLVGSIAFAIAWYLMVWLYRKKIFIRI